LLFQSSDPACRIGSNSRRAIVDGYCLDIVYVSACVTLIVPTVDDFLPRIDMYIIKRITAFEPGHEPDSLNISFESYFGKKYCLRFSRDAKQLAQESTPSGAADSTPLVPSLDTFSPVKRKSPGTGEVEINWEKESKPISWRDARKLLRKLRRHMIGLSSELQSIYEAMLHASKHEGRIT